MIDDEVDIYGPAEPATATKDDAIEGSKSTEEDLDEDYVLACLVKW